MARVTVEDCVDKVPNRFDLVMLAAHRAREIASGSPVTVDRDNDKNPVVSLREIADETQMVDDLLERLIESNQSNSTKPRLRKRGRTSGYLFFFSFLFSGVFRLCLASP